MHCVPRGSGVLVITHQHISVSVTQPEEAKEVMQVNWKNTTHFSKRYKFVNSGYYNNNIEFILGSFFGRTYLLTLQMEWRSVKMNTLEDKLNYHIDFLKYVMILHIHSIIKCLYHSTFLIVLLDVGGPRGTSSFQVERVLSITALRQLSQEPLHVWTGHCRCGRGTLTPWPQGESGTSMEHLPSQMAVHSAEQKGIHNMVLLYHVFQSHEI